MINVVFLLFVEEIVWVRCVVDVFDGVMMGMVGFDG